MSPDKPKPEGLFYIQRPIGVVMITIGLIIFGVIAYLRLPQALLPDLNQPSLTVETKMPGASTGEVEKEVTKKVEESLGTVSGLKDMASYSFPERSVVTLTFGYKSDFNEVLQTVREKLGALRLKNGIERSRLLRYDPLAEPVLTLSFTWQDEGRSAAVLREIVEKNIAPSIETLPGVASALIKGGDTTEVLVSFREGVLESFELTPSMIKDKIAANNRLVGLGTIENPAQSFVIKLSNELHSVTELGELIVKQDGSRTIKLMDVATISTVITEPDSVSRVGGSNAVIAEVFKEADANIVATVDLLRSRLDSQLKGKRWLEGISYEVVGDQSVFIKSSIDGVKESAYYGGILALLVLYLFLARWLPSLLVAVSIPVSIAIAFFLMAQSQISINVMSLGGLALGIGMLVDNSIVVLEAIQRQRSLGLSTLAAATKGTREMMGPVIASTMTSVAVFAPLVFVEGIAGIMFNDLALTIVYSLVSSLVVSVVLLPTLYVALATLLPDDDLATTRQPSVAEFSRDYALRFTRNVIASVREGAKLSWRLIYRLPWWLIAFFCAVIGDIVTTALALIVWAGKGLLGVLAFVLRPVGWVIGKLTGLVQGLIRWLEQKAYPALLKSVLAHRVAVLLGFVLLGGAAFWLAGSFGNELLPTPSRGEIQIDARLPPSSSFTITDSTARAFERVLSQTDGVTRFVSQVGIDERQSLLGEGGVNRFSIDVQYDQSTLDLPELKEQIAQIKGVTVKWLTPGLVALSSFPLETVIANPNADALAQATDAAMAKIAELKGITVEKTTRSERIPQVQIVLKPQAMAQLEFRFSDIENTLKEYLGSDEVSTLTIKEKTYPIKIQLKGKAHITADQLATLPILNSKKTSVPLQQLAEVEMVDGPAHIYRLNNARAIRLSLGLGDMPLSEAAQKVTAALSPLRVGSTDVLIIGQSEEFKASQNSLIGAILLSIVLVYIVMASQFESFLQPLLIMVTIPMAFIGVVLFLLPTQQPLNIMVFVGSIVLVGIIVNNAIVYVDTVNTLLKRGEERIAAIVEAGRLRMRPILMTTLTTLLGLLPMALGSEDGAELRIPLAQTIIGGLTFGTVLTLVVIPCLIAAVSMSSRRTIDEV